jgi:hypothetical protein
MAEFAARPRRFAVIVPMQIRDVQESLAIRQIANQIDHRAVCACACAAQRQPQYGAQVIFELRRGRAFDGPVPGVMHAWRDFIRDQFAVAYKKLNGEDARASNGLLSLLTRARWPVRALVLGCRRYVHCDSAGKSLPRRASNVRR